MSTSVHDVPYEDMQMSNKTENTSDKWFKGDMHVSLDWYNCFQLTS